MWTGTQFTGSLAPNASGRWFTLNWPASRHVTWHMVPTSPVSGNPQVEWTVGVERATTANATYWITVKNLTAQAVTFESRFVVLN